MTALGVRQTFSLHAGHRIASEVHLETTTGLLVGRTRSWSMVLWTSARSAAQALVFDADGELLMAGPLHPYDVRRTPRGHDERTDVWACQMSPDVAERARQLAIVQTWNPSWLARLSRSLPTFEVLAGLFADSGMGNLTVGQAMRWPDDEAPWASWPGGLGVLQRAFISSFPTESELRRDGEDVECVAELTGARRA